MNLAAKHPEAIKGLVLLNATPFWSQRPPVGQDTLLWQLLNVDASLPVKHVSRPYLIGKAFCWKLGTQASADALGRLETALLPNYPRAPAEPCVPCCNRSQAG